ncbi:hypothetical protein PV327_008264 [Microctonus hyperodae]|uniref:Peptidase S1 domain-containing protein n=1 Tax=Microctonus hyperodae TaxID=165561 RepID=A0AA39KGW4_MICHY|nr:hypothetical protein PV327_008264 [Microctonus hyperodae]
MFKFFSVIVICTIAHAYTWPISSLGNRDTRIVGGENTTIDKVPYQISLQYLNEHVCGGCIISDMWIITARHCVNGNDKNFTIRAGSTTHDHGGSLHTIAEIFRYENNTKPPHDDIALIRLNEPLYLDETRQPIQMFKIGEVSNPGTIATISGWGNTTNGFPAVLQIANVPIISKAQCNESYAAIGGIPEKQICAGWPDGAKNVCNKDSGGPLVIEKRLAGIVSWGGEDCRAAGFPGVYTEISEYRSWIKGKSEL